MLLRIGIYDTAQRDGLFEGEITALSKAHLLFEESLSAER